MPCYFAVSGKDINWTLYYKSPQLRPRASYNKLSSPCPVPRREFELDSLTAYLINTRSLFSYQKRLLNEI